MNTGVFYQFTKVRTFFGMTVKDWRIYNFFTTLEAVCILLKNIFITCETCFEIKLNNFL